MYGKHFSFTVKTTMFNFSDIKKESFEKVCFCFLSFLPIVAVTFDLDNDIWFLLSHGRYVVTEGIPYEEPLTIHSGFSFVMQQWLSSVFFYKIYFKFGKIGLIGLLVALSIVIACLIFFLTLICSEKKVKTSSLCSFVSILGICLWFVQTRPQTLTYIIILIEILALELYVQKEKTRYLLPLPLLSLLQINLHASMWGLLFVFMLPYFVNAFSFKWFVFSSKGYKKSPLIIATLLMFVVGFVNPYGKDAMLYVVSSYGQELIDNTVTEMASLTIKEFHGIYFFVIVFLTALLFIGSKKTEFSVRYALLFVGTALLSLLSQKSLAYFFIACVPFLSNLLSEFDDSIVLFNENQRKNRFVKCFLPIYLVLVFVVSLGVRVSNYNENKSYPGSKGAIDYLTEYVEDTASLKIYTNYTDGGYAEYKGFKVYMDARAEVFIKANNDKEDIFLEYICLQEGELHYSDFLDKYSFDYIVVDNTDLLSCYLQKDDDFVVIYKDDLSQIYTKNKGEI